MHENTVSAVGEIERNRLVHLVRLRALRVGDEEIDLLSHLVQAGRRLTASVDAFAGLEAEHGSDAAGIVDAALPEAERNGLDLADVVVVAGPGLGEDLAGGILEHQTPGLLYDGQGRTFGAGIDDFVLSLGAGPGHVRVGCDELRAEHHLLDLLGLDERSEHPDAYGTVRDEVHLEIELRVVLIAAGREILHAKLVHHHGVGVEGLARLEAVTPPLHLSLTGRRIEIGQFLREEIDGSHVHEVAAQVRSLIHQPLT